MSLILNRRSLVLGAAATLVGCDRLAKNETVRETLFSAANFHKWAQRSLMARDALAREFRPDQISPFFRPNGTANPNTPEYKALWRRDFADWRLDVAGLVARPLSLSLAQIRALPHREQITRHDCVEGWSAIGKWRGVPLKRILDELPPFGGCALPACRWRCLLRWCCWCWSFRSWARSRASG